MFLWLAIAVALAAADGPEPKKAGSLGDVTLTDGRTLRGVVVMSQSATALSVRHAGGLTKIDKKLLPPALRAQFPVDEALAAKEQAAAQADREKAAALKQEREAAERARVIAEKAAKAAAEKEQAANPINPRDARVVPTTVPKMISVEDQMAHAPDGLFLVSWSETYGDVRVRVRNPGISSHKFEFRQIQALALDGTVIAPRDVIFPKTEVANYWLDGSSERFFHLVFPGKPKLAALSWTVATEWRLRDNELSPFATSAEAALQQTRETAAAAKAAANAQRAQQSAEYNARLVEKKTGN